MSASETGIGTVALTVSDLDRSRTFYEQLLGMRAAEQDDGSLTFRAAASGPPLLSIIANGGQPRLDRRATGLYHFAVLLPTRRDLAVALVRIASAKWPISGASDHLVSEALYLDDPDGIGIEIYRDRERSEWPHDADGRLEMATLPMDVDGVLAELNDAPVDPDADRLLPAGTRIGHVHLQVAELREIEQFYTGLLGLDVTVRGYPGALFVSAEGYHHHIGLNTWHSAGGSPPAPGAVGLRHYELRMPDSHALDTVLARLDAAGHAIELDSARRARVRDPSGNAVLLTA